MTNLFSGHDEEMAWQEAFDAQPKTPVRGNTHFHKFDPKTASKVERQWVEWFGEPLYSEAVEEALVRVEKGMPDLKSIVDKVREGSRQALNTLRLNLRYADGVLMTDYLDIHDKQQWGF